VRFGAWYTNMMNYMFLGLSSEMSACINAMKSICSTASVHREDYLLSLAFLDHTYRFDGTRFLSIDLSKLSPDAVPAYKLTAISIALFSSEDTPESSIRLFEATCKEMELLGIAPSSLIMHGLLAMLYSRKGNMDAKLHHMDTACRIGFENGLIGLLARCTSLDIDTWGQCLCKYGEEFASIVQDRCLRNRKNWQLAYAGHSGPTPAIDVNIFEGEIMLLLIYKTPIADIAMLKNVTETEVRKTIRELCARLGLKSKKELVELSKIYYSSDSKPEPQAGMPGRAGNAAPDMKEGI